MSDPPPVVVKAPVAIGTGTQRVTYGQEDAEEMKEAASRAEGSLSTSTLMVQMMQKMDRMQDTQRRQDERMQETQRRQDEKIERLSALLAQSKASEQQQLLNELLEERNINTAADTLRTPISTSVKRPFPPAAQRGLRMPSEPDSPLNKQQDGDGDGRASMAVGVAGLQFKDILTMVPKNVTPFYADTNKCSGSLVSMSVGT